MFGSQKEAMRGMEKVLEALRISAANYIVNY